MPRKRKATNASTRGQPKVPDGDEGADLEAALKKEKLNALLADFDTEMNSFYAEIGEMLQDFEKSLKCSYLVEINKLPKVFREMKLEDYMNAGGELTPMTSDKMMEDMMDIENSIMPGLATLTKSKKKDRKKKKATCTPMEGIEEDTGTVQKKTGRGRKKALSTAVNASNNVMPPPPSTARTQRTVRQKNMFETPAQFGGPSARGWETPLITPKFDPRLPVTPNMMRRPKAGEVMMSLAGSPISNVTSAPPQARAAPSGALLLPDGKELDLENIQVPDFSSSTMDYLSRLREKLNTIPLPQQR